MKFVQVGKAVINLDAIAHMRIIPEHTDKFSNESHFVLGIYFIGAGVGSSYDSMGYLALYDDDATAFMTHLEWASPAGTWTTLKEVS